MHASRHQQAMQLPLDKAAEYLLEECRMVLPGLQGLFGFQMIAVFSDGFSRHLDHAGQVLHLLAIVLVVLAIALVMAPAALHRQTDPYAVSSRFIRVSGRLVLAAMPALAIALALDFYLVAGVVFGATPLPALAAIAIGLFFGAAWFLLPRLLGRHQG